ncbi:hypothetical protein V6N12_001104 [Hibiscus sabdariffa]|uniref:F-box domain-containing protein n=1 Tax=Hibiscus sabdariffa TaxID=183260 RepID=A0ABR2C6D1_9ROSI
MVKLAKCRGSLDNLPDPILCHILSFLPARDAVRTSILSRRWRYLFTSSISKLDFHDIKNGLPDLGVARKQHIKSFKKTLHLKDMEFVDGCSSPRLISGSPVLEDFGPFSCFVSISKKCELEIR